MIESSGHTSKKSERLSVCSLPQLQVAQNDPREKWRTAPGIKKPATTKAPCQAWPLPRRVTMILPFMVKLGFKIHCLAKITQNSKHGTNSERKMKVPSFCSRDRLSYSISLSQNAYEISCPQQAFETNTPLLHRYMKKSSASPHFFLLQLHLFGFFSFGEWGNFQINAVSLWADLTRLL